MTASAFAYIAVNSPIATAQWDVEGRLVDNGQLNVKNDVDCSTQKIEGISEKSPLGILLPGQLRNEARRQDQDEGDPEQIPVKRDNGDQVQNAGDAEKRKKNAVYSAVDPAARATVQETAYPRPGNTGDPENMFTSQGQHRKLVGLERSYNENSRYAP